MVEESEHELVQQKEAIHEELYHLAAKLSAGDLVWSGHSSPFVMSDSSASEVRQRAREASRSGEKMCEVYQKQIVNWQNCLAGYCEDSVSHRTFCMFL